MWRFFHARGEQDLGNCDSKKYLRWEKNMVVGYLNRYVSSLSCDYSLTYSLST